MKDTLEALAEKASDEEFKDRVAIEILPKCLDDYYEYVSAIDKAYFIAELMLEEKKRRNNA